MLTSPELDYPLRHVLNDEVHARPPDGVPTPASISYIARKPADEPAPTKELLQHLIDIVGGPVPPPGAKHFTTEFDSIRLRWERHTEFSRYSLVSSTVAETPFAEMPSHSLPAEWAQRLKGEVLVATQALVIEMPDWKERIGEISKTYFAGNLLIGSIVADGRGVALTDLRIHADGFSRILLINLNMGDQQTGRLMQRLLELETYRMMALLALPIAQELSPDLDRDEQQLEEIGAALLTDEDNKEQLLLGSLSRLSATTQHRQLRSNYRFAAADAYYEIVLQRISELREQRIIGVQTFEEFTTRRLTPAVRTYRAVARRQQSILEQMGRAIKLLSTRIDVARQKQNQILLESMNRRVRAQLRMQATVEGLSVAAVTYYISGLINLLAKGAYESGAPINPTMVTGISIPIIGLLVYGAVRRLKKKISAEEDE